MSLRRLLYILFAGILLAGCAPNNPAILTPFSTLAAQLANLYWLLFWMGLAVFIFVVILLVIALVRGNRRAQQPGEVRQIQGNIPIEIVWTAIPVILVIFIFVTTVRTMAGVSAPADRPQGELNVRVIGHRWWWEFEYPDLGIKTANEMHIPAGKNVHLELISADVVHSFWVPNLNGKMDVVPGIVNKTWIRSEQPGAFGGNCTEYCGMQHANMNLKVIAQSQADFDAWVANQQQPAPQAQTEAQKAGEQIVTAGICSTCHAVNGTNAKGLIGPNLTHLHSRSIIAGGVMELNDGNLLTWLKNPDAVKPGNLMANVRLTDQQIEQVMAYLATLK